MEPRETQVWAVFLNENPSIYIARLVVVNHVGERNVTELCFGRSSLLDLRKELKAKGLEPLPIVEDDDGALEYWV